MTTNTKTDVIFENIIDEEDTLDIDDDIDDEGEVEVEEDDEDLFEDDSDSDDSCDEILEDLDELLDEFVEEKEDYEEEEEKIVVKRTSFNILTKYEKNLILGFRTQQIINGSVILIDVNKLTDKSAYAIAQQELVEKRIPFKIKRPFPDGRVEIWDLEELLVF